MRSRTARPPRTESTEITNIPSRALRRVIFDEDYHIKRRRRERIRNVAVGIMIAVAAVAAVYFTLTNPMSAGLMRASTPEAVDGK